MSAGRPHIVICVARQTFDAAHHVYYQLVISARVVPAGDLCLSTASQPDGGQLCNTNAPTKHIYSTDTDIVANCLKSFATEVLAHMVCVTVFDVFALHSTTSCFTLSLIIFSLAHSKLVSPLLLTQFSARSTPFLLCSYAVVPKPKDDHMIYNSIVVPILLLLTAQSHGNI